MHKDFSSLKIASKSVAPIFCCAKSSEIQQLRTMHHSQNGGKQSLTGSQLVQQLVKTCSTRPELRLTYCYQKETQETPKYLFLVCWSVRCAGHTEPVCCHIPAVGVSVWENTGRWIYLWQGSRWGAPQFPNDLWWLSRLKSVHERLKFLRFLELIREK